jgi:hypothetical protein
MSIVGFGLIMAAAQWGVVAATICAKDRRGTHRHIQQARQVVDADAGRRLMACVDALRLASLGAIGEQHGAWRGSEGSLEGGQLTLFRPRCQPLMVHGPQVELRTRIRISQLADIGVALPDIALSCERLSIASFSS